MRWPGFTAFFFLVGCGGTTRNAPAPQSAQPHDETALASPGASAASAPLAEGPPTARKDGLYACHPARGRVAVTLEHAYSAQDVATWYMAVTCNAVVVPKHAVARRADHAVDAVVEENELDNLLQTMLTPLDLAAVTQRGITVFFDNREGVVESARRGEPRIVLVPAPVYLSPLPADRGAADADDAEPTEVEPGIRRLSETHYEVEATFVDRVLNDPMQTARGARIVPSIKNGKANGFKLYAIRPSSVYAKVGFQNGDTVHAINGFALTTPDVALDVYERVKDADHLEFDITRRGKKILLVIDIE